MYSKIRLFTLSCFALVLLSGCSSIPANLDSQAPNLISDYRQWNQTTELQTPIRLGGVIAKVDNLADRTRIEVVNLPISSKGKPDIDQEPDGRFVAYVDGFADPVKLSEGRLITVLGRAKGVEEGKVGEFDYRFMVMDQGSYHLWRIEERVVVNNIDSYLYPCRSLHCRSISYGSQQGTVVQQVK